MDVAAELLAMDRCLRAVTFQCGDRVHDGQGRTGTVLAGRLGIDGRHVENEFQIAWDDGDVVWLAERRLSWRLETQEVELCASAMNSSIG